MHATNELRRVVIFHSAAHAGHILAPRLGSGGCGLGCCTCRIRSAMLCVHVFGRVRSVAPRCTSHVRREPVQRNFVSSVRGSLRWPYTQAPDFLRALLPAVARVAYRRLCRRRLAHALPLAGPLRAGPGGGTCVPHTHQPSVRRTVWAAKKWVKCPPGRPFITRY